MTKAGRPAGKTEKLTEIFTRVSPEEKKRLEAAHKQYNKDKGLKLSFSAYLATLVSEAPKPEEIQLTLTEQTYVNNTFWAMVNKKSVGPSYVGGREIIHPVVKSESKSGNNTATQIVNFTIPYVSHYQLGTIDSKTIEQYKDNRLALEQIKKLTTDNMIDNLGSVISQDLYRDGKEEGTLFGLNAWLPVDGVQEDDNFCGVNRSVDSVRLAGTHFDATRLCLEDAIIQGVAIVAKAGGKVDTIFMSYDQYSKLIRGNGSKVVIEAKFCDSIFFPGIELLTAMGQVMVYPDRNCPSDRIYGLKMDTWTYHYLGNEAVMVYNLDGIETFRQANSDGLEYRIFTMGNLTCSSPKDNFVAKVNFQTY